MYFNGLKILIFPVNNQETFPVEGRANQSVWEAARVALREGFDAVHSPLHCFSVALFTFRAKRSQSWSSIPCVFEILAVWLGIILSRLSPLENKSVTFTLESIGTELKEWVTRAMTRTT